MYKQVLALLLLQMPILLLAQEVRIGIGTTLPQAPLDLGNVSGNRMVFWGEGSQTHYGIGSQNGNMQIYANLSVDNIGFGLGRSTAFAENLRMKGNGMVGIYNNNPAYKLDINGRIKLSGAYTSTLVYDSRAIDGYYWKPFWDYNYLIFNNGNNSGAVAKIGASAYIGSSGFFQEGIFFGIHDPSNNKLRLGTLSSYQPNGTPFVGLAINGSAGTSGQILRSRGLNGAAGWTNTILKELHNGLINAYGGNQQLSNQLTLVSLEKMEYMNALETDPYDNSYDLKTASKLLVKIRVSATNNGCDLCGKSIFDIVLADNGTVVRTYRFSIPENTYDIHETATALLDLPPGMHQLKLGGYMVSGPTVYLGNLIAVPINTYTTDGLRMSVEVIPSFK